MTIGDADDHHAMITMHDEPAEIEGLHGHDHAPMSGPWWPARRVG
jgi:Cd2+/Zn2+-exporting ATPase